MAILNAITHKIVYVRANQKDDLTFKCYFNHIPVLIDKTQLKELQQSVTVEMITAEGEVECVTQLQRLSAQVWPGWEKPFKEQKENRSQWLHQMNIVRAWRRFPGVIGGVLHDFEKDYTKAIQKKLKLLEGKSIKEKAEALENLMGQPPKLIEAQLRQEKLKPDLYGFPLPQVANCFTEWADCNQEELAERKTFVPNKINLTEFPSVFIHYFSNITYLNLSHNRLCHLPEEIGQLKHLEELDLKSNAIAYFPPSVAKLSKLKFVNLNDNTSYVFPLNIERIPHLEKLWLWSYFSHLPERFHKMNGLIEVVINSNSDNVSGLDHQRIREWTQLESCRVTSRGQELFEFVRSKAKEAC